MTRARGTVEDLERRFDPGVAPCGAWVSCWLHLVGTQGHARSVLPHNDALIERLVVSRGEGMGNGEIAG